MMNSEKEKQGLTKRKDRKGCLVPVGKEQFGFCKGREMLRYKYLCHEKLTKDEWEQCERCDQCIGMPYSYYDWSEEIKKKYGTYDLIQLIEFDKYLELCIRKRKVNQEASNILYAAMASCGLAIIFDNILFEYTGNMGLIASIVIGLIVTLGIVFLIMVIVNAVFSPIHNNNLEWNMYKDYQSVIEEMIEAKKEKLKKTE